MARLFALCYYASFEPIYVTSRLYLRTFRVRQGQILLFSHSFFCGLVFEVLFVQPVAQFLQLSYEYGAAG